MGHLNDRCPTNDRESPHTLKASRGDKSNNRDKSKQRRTTNLHQSLQKRRQHKQGTHKLTSMASNGLQTSNQDDYNQAPVIVIMVPFPAQSHLNQLLRFSCLISSHNIPVHYASSAIHIHQVKLRAQGYDPVAIARIHFHDLSLDFVSPSPNPEPSTKFPTHLLPLFEAAAGLREPFAELLHDVAGKARRVVIIHDALMASVVHDAASLHNTETYAYRAFSAFYALFSSWRNVETSIKLEIEKPEFPSTEGCLPSEGRRILSYQSQFLNIRDGDLLNTSRVVEDTCIDLQEKVHGKNQWAIGPLHPVISNNNSNGQDNCLKWLDRQPPKSVMYISFGSTTTLIDEQIKELVVGLEQSKAKFIWVLRNADKADIFTEDNRRIELPEGFEKRIEDMGMIVRDWAPQLEILRHPSTGGFMSHCGWNSCLEGISLGVPIAAWPMHSDQPLNAVLIADVLKVGLVVKKWTHLEKVTEASYVKDAITRLMASEEGNEIRKRADSVRESFEQNVGKDGASSMELESFVAHITR